MPKVLPIARSKKRNPLGLSLRPTQEFVRPQATSPLKTITTDVFEVGPTSPKRIPAQNDLVELFLGKNLNDDTLNRLMLEPDSDLRPNMNARDSQGRTVLTALAEFSTKSPHGLRKAVEKWQAMGGNIHGTNANDETALMVAKRCENQEMISLLKELLRKKVE